MTDTRKNFIRRVAAAMEQHHPRSKRGRPSKADSYEQIAQAYLDAALTEIFAGLKHQDKHTGHIRVVKQNINNSVTQQYDRKKWSQWLIANFPLWRTIHSGGKRMSGGGFTASVVEIAIPAQTLMEYNNMRKFDTDSIVQQQQQHVHAQCEVLGLTASSVYTDIPIDVENLGNYIDYTLNQIHTGAVDAQYAIKLASQVDTAQRILALAQHPYPEFDVIRQIHSEPGVVDDRTYFTGINLQTCPRTVRHAALGDCSEMDVNAGIFAFLFESQCELMGVKPDLHELNRQGCWLAYYLLDKQVARAQVAKQIMACIPSMREAGALKLAKQVITTVGFGGKASGHHNSLSDIIYDPQARTTLMKSEFLRGLSEQVKVIQRMLGENHRKTQGVLDSQFQDGRGIRHAAIASMLYRKWESNLMDNVRTAIGLLGGEVVITVHDCVYFRNLSSSRLAEIRQWVAENYGEHVGFSVEHRLDFTNVKPINHYTNHNLHPVTGYYVDPEHQARMEQQEIEAQGYHSNVVDITPPPQKPDYDQLNSDAIRLQQGEMIYKQVQQGTLPLCVVKQDTQAYEMYVEYQNSLGLAIWENIKNQAQLQEQWQQSVKDHEIQTYDRKKLH